MKVYVRAYDKFCYPDVQLSCEQGIRHSKYVENPVLVVEVLSDSTESYDRGLKFEQYRSIESLQYYLLVDQHRRHVELYERRSQNTWTFTEPQDQLLFPSLAVVIDVEDIYRQVEFLITDNAS
jgi:Uma2 family endonuclease